MSLLDDTIAESAVSTRSVLAALAQLPLFADLDPAAIADIATEIEWFSVPGGTMLFGEGEPGDAMYFVIAGRVGAYVRQADGRERLVARIGPGECVGEMALICGATRTASIVAMRDSEVCRWSKAAFDRAVALHPQALMRIARLMAARLDAQQRAAAAPVRVAAQTFAVVPHDVEVDAVGFASELTDALNRIGRTELIWNVRASDHTSHWFDKVALANRFVVYVTDVKPTAWTRQCLRQADTTLLLTRAANPASAWSALDGANECRSQEQGAELVLLHDEDICAGDAQRWLRIEPNVRHHHVRGGADIARVARLITGHGIGLTLSGGGARGFAHIGVIRAFQEAKIPIDAIGGTSIGGIIAGGVAAGWSPDELAHNIKRTFVDTNPLNDYTFPLVALVAGRKVSRLLRQEFGELQIEDLALPYFCVSTNLTTGHAAVHRTGALWQWLRATVAIPGVLPPVFRNGEVYVDGATINNLPVDVMREVGGGPVVGCDVSVQRAFTADLDETETPPLWQLLQRWRGKRKHVNIFQILWRAGMINSAANSATVREHTDLLLRPPLENLDLLNWKAFDRAVAEGYRHACTKLEEWGARLYRH